MVVDESIKQDFIHVLKGAQVDVSFDVFVFVLIGFVSTFGLPNWQPLPCIDWGIERNAPPLLTVGHIDSWGPA
jgi:hypothetical protein